MFRRVGYIAWVLETRYIYRVLSRERDVEVAAWSSRRAAGTQLCTMSPCALARTARLTVPLVASVDVSGAGSKV